MRIRRALRRATGEALVVACMPLLATCSSFLEARNNDAPDVATTLATAAGIQTITATLYQAIWSTNNGAITGAPAPIYMQLASLAFESFTQINQPPGIRAILPRAAISNVRSASGTDENFRDYSGLSKNSRTAANVIIALDKLVASGQTLGSEALNARARGFAFFANGVSLGNLALAYDSAAIVLPGVPSGETPALSGAPDVMRAALASLDTAMAIAGSPVAAGAFPLPATWINGRALAAADFVRFIRSYRARFRAAVSRTPAQRAAVDWAAVIADVNGGIRADLNVLLDPAAGWSNSVLAYVHQFGTFHQMTPMILGMADTSGGYQTWLSLPLGSRLPFLIKTPDRRLPAGETRAAQTTNSPAVPPPTLYFRNRSAATDLAVQTWGSSDYDFYRWQAIVNAAFRGDFPIMTLAEMDLLAAEGYLRTGQLGQAATLIDKYRTRAGLPALSGVLSSATAPVPGGAACVPRVPTPAGNTTVCGTIFEAMKWEKRMETAITGWASWYFDSRGWGDLPEGTALEYPVPYQELDARRRPLYDLGGIGGKSAAARGTYGF